MRVILCLTVWISLVAAAFGQFSGVYFDQKDKSRGIEFLPEGKCFFQKWFRVSPATYKIEKGYLLVTADEGANQELMRLKIDGKKLTDQDGRVLVPREQLRKFPWKNASPVTMVVVDSETGEPIREFGYTYKLKTHKAVYDPLLIRPIPVKSDEGRFSLLAPPACEIDIKISAPDLLEGYGTYKSYDLTSENEDRLIEVRVARGVTVKGVVVDKQTGHPIAGAQVAPVVFMPPLFVPDWDHAVKTDKSGHFTLHGVDASLGIGAKHIDYLRGGAEFDDELFEVPNIRIKLEKGERFFGVVKDSEGKPIAGVHLTDHNGKTTQSKDDGTFEMMSPAISWGGQYTIEFEKEGYIDQEVKFKKAKPEGYTVVLESCPMLVGRVLGDDGRPVARAKVFAGPGSSPSSYHCSSQEIVREGEPFSLDIKRQYDYDKEGIVWIGVRAPGFAIWEKRLDAWKGTKSLDIRLRRGVSLSGKVQLPDTAVHPLKTRLLAERVEDLSTGASITPGEELRILEAKVARDGTFRFPAIRPGRYVLAIYGQGVTPEILRIGVPRSGRELASRTLRGTGTVFGQIFTTEGAPWSFANGEIYLSDPTNHTWCEGEMPYLRTRGFKTDQQGFFRVENVPAGIISVHVPYHITADIIGAHTQTARVLPGKATEARINAPSDVGQPAVFEFVVGDGSKEQHDSGTGISAHREVSHLNPYSVKFLIQLAPLDNQPVAWSNPEWEELDAGNMITLPDVGMGKYRVTIASYLLGRYSQQDALFQADLDIVPGKTIRVPLGAGCITGQIVVPNDVIDQNVKNNDVPSGLPRPPVPSKKCHGLEVRAIGKKNRQTRYAYTDGLGHFLISFLEPDNYVLYVHDDKHGWCLLGTVDVNNNSPDVATHEMKPGGTITGEVILDEKGPANGHIEVLGFRGGKVAEDVIRVRATDEQGISVGSHRYEGKPGETFTISGLWPGQWNVALLRGDKVIAEKKINLKKTETVNCNLQPRQAKKANP